MTMFYDGTDSADFEAEEVFAGQYYGDVLEDDAFIDVMESPSDRSEAE